MTEPTITVWRSVGQERQAVTIYETVATAHGVRNHQLLSDRQFDRLFMDQLLYALHRCREEIALESQEPN